MKKRWLPIFSIVSAILVMASATSAYAQAATVYRYSGQGAAAYFSSVDELGCKYTNIFVQFGEATAGNPPKPSEQPTLAYMYISQWNACTGESLSAQTDPPAVLPKEAVQVAPHLQSASLNATVNLFDYNNNITFPADVSVSWTATGERPTRIVDRVHYLSPLGFNHAYTKSLGRPANAIGSVLVEGVNLTPSPWGEAWIEQEVRGSILIIKKP